MPTSARQLPAGYAEHGLASLKLSRRRDPVETLWTYRAARPHVSLILPDGRADVILRFRVDGRGGCRDVVPILTGPSSRWYDVEIAEGDRFVGLRLRPGHLGCLGGLAGGLRDRRLAGEEAVALLPGLAVLDERYGSFQALTDAFLGAVPESDARPLVERALDRLHLSGGRLAVGDLAGMLRIGPRHLHRLFADHVGLEPQRYAAVLRFQRAARLLRSGLTPAQAAHEAGYADQPHMTRAFRRYGGFTPARMPNAELVSLPMT